MKIDVNIAKTRVTEYIMQAKWLKALIPLIVLTLYFISFSWFLSRLLPEYAVNVNAVFVSRSWKVSLFLAAVLYLLFFILFAILKGNTLIFKNRKEKFYAGDFILILLPLTPIVQYIIKNQSILSPLDSIYVLSVFIVFSVLYIIAIPALLGIVTSRRTMTLLGLAFTFTITDMASLSAQFHWIEQGDLIIQIAVFIAVFLISWILYTRAGRKFLYIAVALCLITNSAIQLMPEGETLNALGGTDNISKGALNSTNNKLVDLIGSKVPVFRPNIYLLVYDSYVANETMLQYGIDNSDQEKYLEQLGFKLYPHTYSVANATLTSMSRILNASAIVNGREKNINSGDGITQNLLKRFGYDTYGIFPSSAYFYGMRPSYDFTFPKVSSSSANLLVKAIFMGEFRFDVQFDKISHEQFVDYKLATFKSIYIKPRFIYVNTDLPVHSQNSGACLPDEIVRFRDRLIKANEEMKIDVGTIAINDPNAIIIVVGDHGPYLTKNCIGTGKQYDISEISRLDIQDRFGAFLAIKWPTEDYSKYDDITVSQDLFPAVFSYIFKDSQLLEAKVEPTTLMPSIISGAAVKNGIIYGGINNGEPLFLEFDQTR